MPSATERTLGLRNRYAVPLLFLLMVGGTAAAPTPETLYREARAASDRGETGKAGAIAQDALKRYGDSDDAWMWRLRAIGATSLINAGSSDKARNLLLRPFPKSLLGTEADLERLEGLAYAAQRLRKDAAGRAYIAQAYELAKKRYPQVVARVLVMRAIIEPVKTTRLIGEALQYLQKYPDKSVEYRARGTLGFFLANNDRFDEAIATWEPMLSRARQLGNQSTVQKLEGNLGWAYQELGDYENAAVYFSQAHATATRIGSKSDVVTWTYQLGDVRMRQGDFAGAGQQYRLAYNLATQTDHRQRANVLALLANYELRTGRLAEARHHIDESIRALRAAKNDDDELRSMVIAGHVAAAQGRFDEGERLLKEVLSRAGSIATLSEAHGRLAQLYAKKGNFAAAEKQFSFSIAKAREARQNVDDRELRFAFFTSVSELFESYVDFLVARGRNAEALAVTEMSRAQTLEDALPVAADPRDVRTIARDTGATILCYWLGGMRSWLWIVTPQKVEVVRLPPQRTIESLVDEYQRVLLGARGSLKMSGDRGIALWETVAAPAAPFIAPGSRVIIVPHGRLAAFNLETLVVPEPKPHYWIEDATISTAGSLALLARPQRKRSGARRLLLVGNPPPAAREFVALPRAHDEMEQVASHFDRNRTLILSGAKATPSAYRSASPEAFAFLHFVAHGVPTRLKPLDSAIVLAREGETFKLYARDIAKQPLNARLVTISSCHGAGTRAYAGEGLVGLGWAFLHAGADNVVAALWEVNDEATPAFMNRFYRSLAKDVDPATALRDAKLSLLRGGGSNARPLYWAPFLLYGSS
jgi:tetratricopeptide (TPR) repeat protein